MKLHIHYLGFFCLTVVVTIPLAVELSVFIGADSM